MAVAPKFAAHILSAPSGPVHTIELYLDYVCPFSAKLFNTIHTQILPILSSRYPKARLLLRHQIQPWHPTSTLAHEAALAVERLSPPGLLPFSAALMKRQREFFDVSVVHETRNQTYTRLAALAEEATGVDAAAVLALLKIPEVAGEGGALNSGNQVTDDLKLHIKAARLVGIHVSPTVVFNGIVENAISSGWTKEQWVEWLDKNVV